ncbi:MAG: TerB family tellurite resistance protein [Bacteroidota bacterium]|uniref:TerB family tellurite resistance protein n=1 Tax=Mucilaginibacter inviolabilis TaxID=2714892 RepID=UPI00140B3664|nr:TerB family tellurite resistance protein [Mucilaginibacter inviolabilis]NHA05851.1 TerB family tellurite resistance protein [Mucilaginibacter inviolabilis]
MESIKRPVKPTILKKVWLGLICGLMCTLSFQCANAQISTGQDMQQLLLDIEKLTQFKAILSDMQQGYSILTQGYGQVKDLSQGNFNLHSIFLNALLQVNPEIAKYARVADIIADEANILTEYKKAYRQFQGGGHFNADELNYLAKVYAQLTGAALNDVNDLANVITASKMRMSDDERLLAIDRIYASSNDKLSFLRDFNSRVSVMALQRQQEQNEVNNLKTLYP